MPEGSVKSVRVVHNSFRQRFEVETEGQLWVLDYRFKSHRLFLTHTKVPPAIRGQELAMELAHAALEYARQNGMRVTAICPLVREYVNGHPEYRSLLTTTAA